MDQIDRLVLTKVPWEQLSPVVKQAFNNSKAAWAEVVVDRSFRYQLRWAASLVQDIIRDEKEYYSEMVKKLQKYYLVRSIAGGGWGSVRANRSPPSHERARRGDGKAASCPFSPWTLRAARMNGCRCTRTTCRMCW